MQGFTGFSIKIITESALWTDSFYKSKWPTVCLFTFEELIKRLFAAQKKCFWENFALLSRIFLVLVLLSISVERFFFSRMREFK